MSKTLAEIREVEEKPGPTIVTAADLIWPLQAHGADMGRAWVADGVYCLPSRLWVEGVFSGAWIEAKDRLGMTDYEPGSGDCDDYADMCAAYAKWLHRVTPMRPSGAALAFGVAWYRSAALGGRHALCLFWHGVEGKPVLGFFEPQQDVIIELVSEEIRTAQVKF